MPPFHYGSHYSNAGIVSGYVGLRLQWLGLRAAAVYTVCSG